jgi:hypothetical protein
VARRLIEEPFRRSPRLRGRPRLVVAIAVIGAVALVGGTTVVRDVALIASRSPAQRTFSAATFDTPRINGDGCNTEQAADSTARLCEYNNAGRDEAASVLLFGDSHAGHWFPALEAVARDRH